MTVTITSQLYTYTNGNANDASQVNAEVAALYANDSALKTKVDILLAGGMQDASSVIIDSDNAGASVGNMSYLVNRGTTGADTGIRWNETDDRMELTNEGTYWSHILSPGFIDGLKLSWTTASQITISTGFCMDSTNKYMMQNSATKLYDTSSATSAAAVNCRMLGIADTGNVWYYLYLIGKTNGTTACLATTSATTIATYPTGYSFHRLIGAFRQTATTTIRKFYQSGRGSVRDYYWDDIVSAFVSSAPAAGSWVDQDISSTIPTENTQWAWLEIYHRHNAAPTASVSPYAKVRPNGSSSSLGMLQAGLINTTAGDRQANSVTGLVYTDANGIIEHTRSVASVNIYSINSLGFRMEV